MLSAIVWTRAGALPGWRVRPTHRDVAQARRRAAHLRPVRRLPAAHGLGLLRPHTGRRRSVDRAGRHPDDGRRLVRVLGALLGRQRRRQRQRNVDTPHRQR